MILAKDMYVPALRWRLGEYQALFRLTNGAKDKILPYITIPEIEFDFEEWKPKKSVQEHVHPFAKRFHAKWGERPAWVGVHSSIADQLMDDGSDVLTYAFAGLRNLGTAAIPAVPLDAGEVVVKAAAVIVKLDQRGVAISVRFEDLMKPNIAKRIAQHAGAIGASLESIDLVIDIGAPNFEPYDTFAGALVQAIEKIGNLDVYRNLVLLGTAIPETFKDVAKGKDEITRHDWLFYRVLISKMPKEMRRPTFGDYTIVHPNFTPMDMRKVKSAGKLVYATSTGWEVRKGGSFRDNPQQMHDHCASILSSGKYRGPDFCSADDYISKCANHKEGPSSQTKWKEVAINHHITQVLDDLAKLGAAS